MNVLRFVILLNFFLKSIICALFGLEHAIDKVGLALCDVNLGNTFLGIDNLLLSLRDNFLPEHFITGMLEFNLPTLAININNFAHAILLAAPLFGHRLLESFSSNVEQIFFFGKLDSDHVGIGAHLCELESWYITQRSPPLPQDPRR